MSNDGTGMTPPPNNTPSGAVTSQEATRKKPVQSKFKSGQKPLTVIDRNKHGIRRETTIPTKRTGRPKKV